MAMAGAEGGKIGMCPGGVLGYFSVLVSPGGQRICDFCRGKRIFRWKASVMPKYRQMKESFPLSKAENVLTHALLRITVDSVAAAESRVLLSFHCCFSHIYYICNLPLGVLASESGVLM